MPFEFLSDEQVARYGRFSQEPSVAELEQFFRLDRVALEQVDERRRPSTKLGCVSSGAADVAAAQRPAGRCGSAVSGRETFQDVDHVLCASVGAAFLDEGGRAGAAIEGWPAAAAAGSFAVVGGGDPQRTL